LVIVTWLHPLSSKCLWSLAIAGGWLQLLDKYHQ
jgi:hypothetical protein